jgi:hypothetical protein
MIGKRMVTSVLHHVDTISCRPKGMLSSLSKLSELTTRARSGLADLNGFFVGAPASAAFRATQVRVTVRPWAGPPSSVYRAER